MRRHFAIFALLLGAVLLLFAQSVSNNTSACSGNGVPTAGCNGIGSMPLMTNPSNLGAETVVVDPLPGTVSSVNLHTLLYSDATTWIGCVYLPWFSNVSPYNGHQNIGMEESNAAQVLSQLQNMKARGCDTVVVDYYGTDSAQAYNLTVTQALAGAIAANPSTTPQLAIMLDQGSVNNPDQCPEGMASPTSCLITNIEAQMDYVAANWLGQSYYQLNSKNSHVIVFYFITQANWPGANFSTIYSAVATHATAGQSCGSGCTYPATVDFVDENAGAFGEPGIAGGFAWPQPNLWGLSAQFDWDGNGTYDYLGGFYAAAQAQTASVSNTVTCGVMYKGFDDHNASWGTNRVIAQQYGGVLGLTVGKIASSGYTSSKQLSCLLVATWNDYEEGHEVETGVYNGISINQPTISGGSINWTFTKADSYVSTNTNNKQQIWTGVGSPTTLVQDNISPGATSGPAPTLYAGESVWIYAVGQPNVLNQLSPPLTIPQSCTPPYLNANCSLTTIPLPTTIPSVGGLTGAGTMVTDPNFGATIYRLTDGNTDVDLPYSSLTPSISGSGEELHINCPKTMIDIGDDGGRDFPMNLSLGSTPPLTLMYNSSLLLPGGFYTVHSGAQWGHNCTYPNRMYVFGNGINNGLSGYGTQFGYYDFSNQSAVPSFTLSFDATSSANCLGSGFRVNYATNGGSDQFDLDFAAAVGGGPDWVANRAYSTSAAVNTLYPSAGNTGKYVYRVTTSGTGAGTEPATWNQTVGGTTTDGTAVVTNIGVGGQSAPGTYYVVIYRTGQGCSVLNVYNGATASDWGPSGTVTGTGCLLNDIHNVKLFKIGGSQGAVDIGMGLNCGSPSQPEMYWTYAAASLTNTYNALCPSQCNGHKADGMVTWVNQTGNDPPSSDYWSGRTLSNLTPSSLVPSLPLAGYPTNLDWHCGWNSLNDSLPFVCSTWMEGGGAIATAWQNEIDAVNPAGATNPWRFAHTFNSSQSSNFNVEIAVGSVSGDGSLFLFTSDWEGALGSVNGQSTCLLPHTCRGDVFAALLAPSSPGIGAFSFSTGIHVTSGVSVNP
jgi:hypothetical protein